MENQNEFGIGMITTNGNESKFQEYPNWAKELSAKIYDRMKQAENDKKKDNDVDLSDGL